MKNTKNQPSETAQDMKAELRAARRLLMAGKIRPDKCEALSRSMSETSKIIGLEMDYAKATGEIPCVSELMPRPGSTAGRILGLMRS